MKNKKIFRNIIAALLVATSVGSLVACGGVSEEEAKKDPNVLNIYLWVGGFGSKYIEDIADAYETQNPEITINIKTTPLREKISMELQTMPEDNKYDIIIGDSECQNLAYTEYAIPGVKNAFYEISDVYDQAPKGETVAVKDKMIEDAGTYYSRYNNDLNYILPLVCTNEGLIYNTEIFEKCGFTHEPRTSQELFEYEEIMKEKGYTPVIYSGYTDYYTILYYTWWRQYQGITEYNKFYEGKAMEYGEWVYSPKIFEQYGRLYSLEALNRFLGYDSGNAEPDSIGLEFMVAQSNFVSKYNNPVSGEKEYKYAMMMNGCWLENEMSQIVPKGSTPLSLMQTPLLSEIVYADTSTDRDNQTPVCTEEQLREVVDYVDGKTTEKPAGIPDTFIEKVREERQSISVASLSMSSVIPIGSKKAELAKDFLRFCYSDTAIEIIAKSNCGAYSIAQYDYTKVEGLMDDLTEVQKKALILLSNPDTRKDYYRYSHPLRWKGGLNATFRTSIFTAFGSKNAKDRKTPLELYQDMINYYNAGKAWSNLLESAGVT